MQRSHAEPLRYKLETESPCLYGTAALLILVVRLFLEELNISIDSPIYVPLVTSATHTRQTA